MRQPVRPPAVSSPAPPPRRFVASPAPPSSASRSRALYDTFETSICVGGGGLRGVIASPTFLRLAEALDRSPLSPDSPLGVRLFSDEDES
jgi:hypothetical protein